MREESIQKTDEEIAKLVQSGKVDFFEILIERYEEKIKRYSRKFLSDHRDIEDVVQEVFLKAYKNIQSFDPKKKFSSWLYRIAHNELVNLLKKKSRFSFIDLDVFLPYLSHDEHLEEKIDRQKMQKIIDQCLDKLEPKYREPIILYFFENLSYQEISDILEIPVSTVGVRIKRAKEKIKNFCQKLGYKYE
jgi:RNA polymerase sigma-70 factor (ECF subfamily)